MIFILLLSYFPHIYNKTLMKRSKNLKITPTTHKILKDYCNDNGLKMFGYVEKLIKDACKKSKDIYGDDI
mgnify:CR=1 FL=1